MRPSSPSNVALMNGASQVASNPTPSNPSNQSSPGGFVAVNSRQHAENGASTSTRHDLMSKFHTTTERRAPSQSSNGAIDVRRPSMGSQPPLPQSTTPVPHAAKQSKPSDLSSSLPTQQQRPSHMSDSELHTVMNSPVPIPNTPSSLLPAASQRAQQPQDKDDGGPFKAEMVHRMESLAKGERILPPCDRCRRLHMDCLKNLTACMGCTKKHAKCSWREVREKELHSLYAAEMQGVMSGHSESEGEVSGSVVGSASVRERGSTGSPVGVGGIGSPRVAGQGQQREERERSVGEAGEGPQEREQSRGVGVEIQLQEAAKSGLAQHHAVRLGGPGGGPGGESNGAKISEYQTLVA